MIKKIHKIIQNIKLDYKISKFENELEFLLNSNIKNTFNKTYNKNFKNIKDVLVLNNKIYLNHTNIRLINKFINLNTELLENNNMKKITMLSIYKKHKVQTVLLFCKKTKLVSIIIKIN